MGASKASDFAQSRPAAGQRRSANRSLITTTVDMSSISPNGRPADGHAAHRREEGC
jgi:hypothetical protein